MLAHKHSMYILPSVQPGFSIKHIHIIDSCNMSLYHYTQSSKYSRQQS